MKTRSYRRFWTIYRIGELCRLYAISVRYLIKRSGFQVWLRGPAVDTYPLSVQTLGRRRFIINAPDVHFMAQLPTPDLSHIFL